MKTLRALIPTRTRRATAVAVAALALLAPACGASGGKEAEPTAKTTTTAKAPADPAKALRNAVDATLAVTSFTIDSTAKLEIGAQLIRLSSSGSFDYDSTVGDLMINFNSTEGSNVLNVRSDGKKFWVRVEGDQGLEIPEGKTWVEGDASYLAAATTLKPAGLVGVVIALRAAEDVKKIDSGNADGIDTTTYETTVSYDDAVKAAGRDAEAFKSALKLKAQKSPDLDMKVQVGSDGIIRSLDLDIQVTDDTPIDGSYEIDLTDVNKMVEAPDAPPAEDTLTGPRAKAILDKIIT